MCVKKVYKTIEEISLELDDLRKRNGRRYRWTSIWCKACDGWHILRGEWQ